MVNNNKIKYFKYLKIVIKYLKIVIKNHKKQLLKKKYNKQ